MCLGLSSPTKASPFFRHFLNLQLCLYTRFFKSGVDINAHLDSGRTLSGFCQLFGNVKNQALCISMLIVVVLLKCKHTWKSHLLGTLFHVNMKYILEGMLVQYTINELDLTAPLVSIQIHITICILPCVTVDDVFIKRHLRMRLCMGTPSDSCRYIFVSRDQMRYPKLVILII